MPIEPTDTPDYVAEIDRLSALIDEAQILAENGQMIDMSNFETMVSVVCARLSDEPPDNPEAVQASIETLVIKLNALSETMKTKFVPEE